MPLTVARLLERSDLELQPLAGQGGLDREVRWAHVIELADPVPWLHRGELVLTIGLGLPTDEAGQRDYVRRLAKRGCAGIGFAQGEIMEHLPPAMLETADKLALPVVAALDATPFIAIVEAVAEWYAEQRLQHERKALDAQDAMVRAALHNGYDGVLRELAQGTRTEVVLLGSSGQVRAAAPAGPRAWHEAVRTAVGRNPSTRGVLGIADADADIHIQSIGTVGTPSGWLALRYSHPEPTHVRLLANHAAALAGVGIERVRAARAEAHRYRAAIFASTLDAGLGDNTSEYATGADPRKQGAGLEQTCPLPPPPFEVLMLRTPHTEAAHMARAVLDALSEVLNDEALLERVVVCPRDHGVLLVLPQRAERLGRALLDHLHTVEGYRAGAGAARASDRAAIAAAVTRATSAVTDDEYHDADNVGAWPLLREAMEPAAVEQFTAAVLHRLRKPGRADTPSHVDCVRAFLDHGANLEAAAHVLGIHRNTLRSRLRTAERLSERSLDDPRSRLELWLAVTLAAEYGT